MDCVHALHTSASSPQLHRRKQFRCLYPLQQCLGSLAILPLFAHKRNDRPLYHKSNTCQIPCSVGVSSAQSM
ncbi:hypothetical protein ACFX2I_013382 [Malus domestica]